jgi:hypothetical protein
MTQTLGQAIKQQIVTVLENLRAANIITSIAYEDSTPSALKDIANYGLPFVIVGMPRVGNDMEDNASNLRTYRFDVLFVVRKEGATDVNYDVEATMDAVLKAFDDDFTLSGAAIGAIVPPISIDSAPISTPDGTYITFVCTIEARTIYELNS